jgi:hypothetical protein
MLAADPSMDMQHVHGTTRCASKEKHGFEADIESAAVDGLTLVTLCRHH